MTRAACVAAAGIFGLKGNAVRWANTPRKPQPKDDQMLQGLAQV